MSSAEPVPVSAAETPARVLHGPLPATDMAEYLDAALAADPGDGSRLRVALGEIARSRGMMRISRETGLAREALYRALSEKGNPELATVLRVLKVLGLQVAIRSVKTCRSRRT